MYRQWWITTLIAVTCCLLVANGYLVNPGIAQQASPNAHQRPAPKSEPPSPQTNWRYQMILFGPNQAHMLLVDSATGRAWVKYANMEWEDLKTPPSRDEKK